MTNSLTRSNCDGDQRMPDVYNFNAILQPMSFSWKSSGDMRGQKLSENAQLWLQQVPAILDPSDMVVRRFTPVECERLMGFPDGYTDVRWYKCCGKELPWHLGPKGCPVCGGTKDAVVKFAADSPRYQALGNSIVVPQLQWIGKRIELISKERF